MVELEYKALDDFLILPVQRIPRYIMLLESMLKYLPAWHPDCDHTKNAVAKMRGFAYNINKRKEARVKLVEISRKLIGYPQEEKLLAESRFLVRDGFLFDDKKRSRFCILLNNELVVTKSAHIKAPSKLSGEEMKKRKFTFEYSILLGSSTKLLVSLAGEPSPSIAATPFTMTLVNQQMKHVFNTPSDEDGKAWVKDIHSVLEHFRKKTPTVQ